MFIKAIKRIGFFFLIVILAGIFFHMARLPQDVVAKPKAPPPLTFSGGSGDTPTDAVIIQNAPDYVAIVAGEYKYLRKKFGSEDRGWRVAEKEVYQHNNKVYDRLYVEFPHGIKRCIFFDITPYFKKP